MRNECHIVRDLMPLCIDHAASQDSHELVDEHICTCESCAEIYGEMTRALPKLQSVRDSRELARTVRQMHRRKAIRAVLIVVAVFFIGVLAQPLLALVFAYVPGLPGAVTQTVQPDMGAVVRYVWDVDGLDHAIYAEMEITEEPVGVYHTIVPWPTETPMAVASTPMPESRRSD